MSQQHQSPRRRSQELRDAGLRDTPARRPLTALIVPWLGLEPSLQPVLQQEDAVAQLGSSNSSCLAMRDAVVGQLCGDSPQLLSSLDSPQRAWIRAALSSDDSLMFTIMRTTFERAIDSGIAASLCHCAALVLGARGQHRSVVYLQDRASRLPMTESKLGLAIATGAVLGANHQLLLALVQAEARDPQAAAQLLSLRVLDRALVVATMTGATRLAVDVLGFVPACSLPRTLEYLLQTLTGAPASFGFGQAGWAAICDRYPDAAWNALVAEASKKFARDTPNAAISAWVGAPALAEHVERSAMEGHKMWSDRKRDLVEQVHQSNLLGLQAPRDQGMSLP